MEDLVNRRRLRWELVVTTLALLVLSRGLFLLRTIPWVERYLAVLIATAFLYVPVLVLWWQRRPIDFLDRNFKSFVYSVKVFAVASLIIFPLFCLGAHFWWVLQKSEFHLSLFPQLGIVLAQQLLLVALPEEFYFRGYFQSTLNRLCRPRWRILGVTLGWSWIITAAVFAVAHTVVVYRWWHFSIFFPALVFGYLRERSRSLTAPILFHAASNVVMEWIIRCY